MAASAVNATPYPVEESIANRKSRSPGRIRLGIATRESLGECSQRQQLPAVYHRRMDAPPDLTAFVLAGGKSTRMGADKAFVMLDGQTLLSRALELARSVTSEVRIVGDPAKFVTFAPVVVDIFPNCGPLGGIHAALRSSQTELNLILAVDVPFVSPALLQYLIERSLNSASATVTVAHSGGNWQPLCAIYRRKFADAAERALRVGRYKIDKLFEAARTRAIAEEELKATGFPPTMFRNLNTREELAEASATARIQNGQQVKL
jgi:molybdenum cofactor guanylyltransferase